MDPPPPVDETIIFFPLNQTNEEPCLLVAHAFVVHLVCFFLAGRLTHPPLRRAVVVVVVRQHDGRLAFRERLPYSRRKEQLLAHRILHRQGRIVKAAASSLVGSDMRWFC